MGLLSRFVSGHDVEIFWALVFALLIAFLIELIFRPFHKKRDRKKQLKALYSFVGESAGLTPQALMQARPFNQYYYYRQEDKDLEQSLRDKKNIVIVGPALSGKSRAVYEALHKTGSSAAILRHKDIDQEAFKIPRNAEVLIIDDLHRFVDCRGFENVFRAAVGGEKPFIVATCRSGTDYDKVRSKMASVDFDEVFPSVLSLSRVSTEVGKGIANRAGKEWNDVVFDGTIGSIFMRLSEMERRFSECNAAEKTILRSLRDLYICGMYEENQAFPINWLRIEIDEAGLRIADYELHGLLENLRDKELIAILGRDRIQAEEVYLECIVKPILPDKDLLYVLRERVARYSRMPRAQDKIASHAYATALIDVRKAQYLEVAAAACKDSLRVYSFKHSPMQFAAMQDNLGAVYRGLAEVDEKAENCGKAVAACNEALRVYTFQRFPVDYAIVHNNLGTAYWTLAQVKGKAENCRKAIAAFGEALRVYTFERFPMGYATVRYNIGGTFQTLAEAENKTENCGKAVAACNEALRVYTFDRFPVAYAMVQNNLGGIYWTLAEVEDKAGNCKKAINAYGEALKVRTARRDPIQLAGTKNNLGLAYWTLAEVEDKAGNCKKAINAYGEALRVFSIERFRLNYATVQRNVGDAYSTLSEAEEKAGNIKKAVSAYREALKVFSPEDFPEEYEMISLRLLEIG